MQYKTTRRIQYKTRNEVTIRYAELVKRQSTSGLLVTVLVLYNVDIHSVAGSLQSLTLVACSHERLLQQLMTSVFLLLLFSSKYFYVINDMYVVAEIWLNSARENLYNYKTLS